MILLASASLLSKPACKWQDRLIFERLKTEVTPRVRHPERVFLRAGSPECGMI